MPVRAAECFLAYDEVILEWDGRMEAFAIDRLIGSPATLESRTGSPTFPDLTWEPHTSLDLALETA